MIEFKRSRQGVYVSLNFKLNDIDIDMQFDSGASFTVISAFALGYNEYEIKYLEQKLALSKYISKPFGAASGEDFTTYLCCADNVVF